MGNQRQTILTRAMVPLSALAIFASSVAWAEESDSVDSETALLWGTAALRFERLASGPSPYPADCIAGQPGINYRNAEVQPAFAINLAHGTLVGAWQQDRWSNGGAAGSLTMVSGDLGRSWTPVVIPFSRCAGGTVANGGDFDRATESWLARARNGDLYQTALGSNLATGETGLMITRSVDGGWSWGPLTTLIRDSDPPFSNDRATITTDPHDQRFAYVVWNRTDRTPATPERPNDYRSPTWFARTTDGGATWEKARPIFDPGLDHQTTFNHIVVLHDGTLVLGFSEYDDTFGPPSRSRPGVVRSHDRGLTWSQPTYVGPTIIAPELGVRDPDSGHPIRTAPGFFIAAHPSESTVFITRLNYVPGSQTLNTPTVVISTDGGVTWSAELQPNKTPAGVTAWPSALAVTRTGKVGLLYFDLRNNTPDPNTLPVDAFLVTCRHRCAEPANWREKQVSGPFDLAVAPDARGYMLGDNMGLDSVGDLFVPMVTKTNSGNLENRTDIFMIVDTSL
jgi:hypothetical protein